MKIILEKLGSKSLRDRRLKHLQSRCEAAKNTPLEEILDVLENVQERLYFIAGSTHSIIPPALHNYENSSPDMITHDLNNLLVFVVFGLEAQMKRHLSELDRKDYIENLSHLYESLYSYLFQVETKGLMFENILQFRDDCEELYMLTDQITQALENMTENIVEEVTP